MLISLIFVFIFSSLTFSTVVAENDTLPTQESNCVLPPYPKHGKYTVNNDPTATPGRKYPSVKLDVSCDAGYKNDKNINSVFCVNGEWSSTMPACVRFCALIDDPSVEYRCGLDSLKGSQKCDSLVPAGTVVIPSCRSPNYYSPEPLVNMHCIEGIWDYKAVCRPECGRISPRQQDLILDGRPPSSAEFPWYATIYNKEFKPFIQICGGSLISTTIVISAATCFWNDVRNILPASTFAVTVGNIHRPYNDPHDRNSQKSDVVEINIPPRFRGSVTNYQDDIAVVVLGTPFSYSPSVRPVCLNYDYNFDRFQLKDGNLGKAASWSRAGKRSQTLNIVDLPYLEIEDCINKSLPGFRPFITSDKICAGSNGQSLCKGDSGAGYAFFDPSERYYLRGVASVGPPSDNNCPNFTTFTSILKHEHFIKQHIN